MINVRDLIGVKYKVHGRSKEEGFDCYGLVIEVMKRCGKEMPDVFYSATDTKSNQNNAPVIINLVKNGLEVKGIEKPEDGCIITLALSGCKTSHAGVYVGEGMMIHCIEPFGVCLENISRYMHLVTGFYSL